MHFKLKSFQNKEKTISIMCTDERGRVKRMNMKINKVYALISFLNV